MTFALPLDLTAIHRSIVALAASTAVVFAEPAALTKPAPAIAAPATHGRQLSGLAALAPADEARVTGDSATLAVTVGDAAAKPCSVTFYGRMIGPVTPGPDFTLVTLPDTQHYSENTGGRFADLYRAQTRWVVANRDTLNIAFVSQLGDIVQNGDFAGNPAEWRVADDAMKILENPATTARPSGIPWGGAPGNHDQNPIGDAAGKTTFFNEYFGSNRFAGRSYYGGHYGADNNNNYQLFSAGGLDFIILHLQYDTRPVASYQPVLDWADALLKTHSQRRAIVTTHWLLNAGNPAGFSAQGQAIFDRLKDNPNLFLLLGGHVAGEARRTDVVDGRSIHSVLQDYQGRPNGGDGWLRYFVFSPAANAIHAKTYQVANTVNSAAGFETDADSDFILPYPMQSAATGWLPLGTVQVAAGTAKASLPWRGMQPGSRYEWYAKTGDATAATRRFATAANPRR